jgi:peroxiredoxin
VRCSARSLVGLAVLALAAGAHAGTPSNPAFLGILMDSNPPLAPDSCKVTGVTRAGAADAAGVRVDDIIYAIDGVRTMNCGELADEIIRHHPGDAIRLDLRRFGELLTIHAQLLTRAEVLNRLFVGQAVDVEVADPEDDRTFELRELRGDTHIVAWYNEQRCVDCATLIRHVSDAATARRHGSAAKLLAVTFGDVKKLGRLSTTLGMPVALAPEKFFDKTSLNERDRVYFMVVDPRGVVRSVTPIAPDSDDVDAAIDEVLAAAEQTEHARLRR